MPNIKIKLNKTMKTNDIKQNYLRANINQLNSQNK